MKTFFSVFFLESLKFRFCSGLIHEENFSKLCWERLSKTIKFSFISICFNSLEVDFRLFQICAYMQSKSAYLTLTSYCKCCSCIENKKIEDWRVADERHNANAMVWNCQYYSKSLINKNLFLSLKKLSLFYARCYELWFLRVKSSTMRLTL